MHRVFAGATLLVFLSGFAAAQEDTKGITVATWNAGPIDRMLSQSPGSSRGNGDLEVGVISRFTIGDVVEFANSENNESSHQERLERPNMEGLANVNAGRGFLVAHIPPQNLIVIGTHLKASRGKTGNPDRTNAQKRELVASAIVDVVNELVEEFPQDTIFVLGDCDIAVTDTPKNRTDLTLDSISGGGNNSDETHALLKDGLVDDVRTKEALGR